MPSGSNQTVKLEGNKRRFLVGLRSEVKDHLLTCSFVLSSISKRSSRILKEEKRKGYLERPLSYELEKELSAFSDLHRAAIGRDCESSGRL